MFITIITRKLDHIVLLNKVIETYFIVNFNIVLYYM